MILLNRAAKQILSQFILNKVLPEIVWGLGRRWLLPKAPPSPRLLLSGGGARGGRKGAQPLDASTPPHLPIQRGGKVWFPDKGEESEGRPHTSLKSPKPQT